MTEPVNNKPPVNVTNHAGVPGSEKARKAAGAPGGGDADAQFDEVCGYLKKMSGLRGLTGSKTDMVAYLKMAMQKGYLTREDLRNILGISITKQAWQAFTFGTSNIDCSNQSLKQLENMLKQFYDYSKVTGTSFFYFASCTEIVILPKEQLLKTYDGLSPDEKSRFFSNHQVHLREMLGIDRDKPVKDVRDAFERMTTRNKEMILLCIYNDLYENSLRKKLELTNLKDVLVARRFMNSMYKDYLTGGNDQLTEKKVNTLNQFAKGITLLRKKINEDKYLDNFDSASPKFDRAIEMARGNESADAIRAYLEKSDIMLKKDKAGP